MVLERLSRDCKHRTQRIISPVRLGVRTPDFHSGNRGSNPLRDTNLKTRSAGAPFFIDINIIMSYIDNCQKHKNTIVDNFSESKCINDFFTLDQVNELATYQFQHTEKLKWTATSNNIQPIIDIDSMLGNTHWLYEKFRELFGSYFHKHTGNFYITTQLHDCHADLMTSDELVKWKWSHKVIPYKSVVIPLLVSDNIDTYTAFFNERYIGTSITLDNDYVSEQKDSMYELLRDHPNFEITNFSNKQYDDFIFPHVGNNTLSGLSVENVFKFVPGNIFVFDACQLHASCASKQSPNAKFLKSGINIQFYREI